MARLIAGNHGICVRLLLASSIVAANSFDLPIENCGRG
jgi:hypothetical protein